LCVHWHPVNSIRSLSPSTLINI